MEQYFFRGKGLTLWRPWPTAMIDYNKRVENRSWQTSYRGALAIHAGTKYDPEAAEFIKKTIGPFKAAHFNPPLHESGCIVAVCELYDCMTFLTGSGGVPEVSYGRVRRRFKADPWAFGPYCWLLRHLTPIVPIPWRGAQRLWDAEFEYQVKERGEGRQ